VLHRNKVDFQVEKTIVGWEYHQMTETRQLKRFEAGKGVREEELGQILAKMQGEGGEAST